MAIKQIPVEFEVDGIPQYVDLESTLYEIQKINRLQDNESSALVIIYREKVT